MTQQEKARSSAWGAPEEIISYDHLILGVETMHVLIAALPVVCYGLALVLGLFQVTQPFGSSGLSPLLQWMLALGLGLPSLWAALGHAFLSEQVAKSIGWATSPFQKEIAGANLGIGLGAVCASIMGPPAAWAIFFVAAGFLWSAAAVHIMGVVKEKNFAVNNVGPIFWWDLITPATILLLLCML
jgi:hypothetical protein